MDEIISDLNVCLKVHSVGFCLSEYGINLTETNEDPVTEEEVESTPLPVIGIIVALILFLIFVVYFAYWVMRTCIIPLIEKMTAKHYTSAHHYYTKKLERNPKSAKAQVLHEIAILNHIKTTYAHHANQPERRRLYQDVVKSLGEYKQRQREARINQSHQSQLPLIDESSFESGSSSKSKC